MAFLLSWHPRANNSVWLECLSYKEVAAGSNPASPTQLPSFGAIAQLGERLLCKQEVVGSIPTGSTKHRLPCSQRRSHGLTISGMGYLLTVADGGSAHMSFHVGGMAACVSAMNQLGMIHWEQTGIPGLRSWDQEQLEAEHDGNFLGYCRAVWAVNPRLAWAPEMPGMCGWKFQSNDEWHVGPIEIGSALAVLGRIDVAHVSEVADGFISKGIQWPEWISHLRQAADFGLIVR